MRRLGSPSTFQRIEAADDEVNSRPPRRKDTKHNNQRAMRNLALIVHPKYAANPAPDDWFAHTEVAQRLAANGCALRLWTRFLAGETDEVPTWDSIGKLWNAWSNIAFGSRRMSARSWEWQQEILDDLSAQAAQAGVIRGDRTRSDFLRWQWTQADVSLELWFRMRWAFHSTQWPIEGSAPILYLAAPVLPFVLLPPRDWVAKLGKGRKDNGEADAEIMNRWEARLRGANRPPEAQPRGNYRRMGGDASWGDGYPDGTAGGAAAALIAACVERHNFLIEGIRLRINTVVALFDEQRTKDFFEQLEEERRAACARHLEALEGRGLILLATTLNEREQAELGFSLSLGGPAPGIAKGFAMVDSTGLESDVVTTNAGTREYQDGRAQLEDVVNSARTWRMHASEIKSLLSLPNALMEAP